MPKHLEMAEELWRVSGPRVAGEEGAPAAPRDAPLRVGCPTCLWENRIVLAVTKTAAGRGRALGPTGRASRPPRSLVLWGTKIPSDVSDSGSNRADGIMAPHRCRSGVILDVAQFAAESSTSSFVVSVRSGAESSVTPAM